MSKSYVNAQKDYVRVTINGPVFSILGDADAVSDAELLALAAGNIPEGWEDADEIMKRLKEKAWNGL